MTPVSGAGETAAECVRGSHGRSLPDGFAHVMTLA